MRIDAPRLGAIYSEYWTNRERLLCGDALNRSAVAARTAVSRTGVSQWPRFTCFGQLTWLALDEDHVARSRRVEQLIALRGL